MSGEGSLQERNKRIAEFGSKVAELRRRFEEWKSKIVRFGVEVENVEKRIHGRSS